MWVHLQAEEPTCSVWQDQKLVYLMSTNAQADGGSTVRRTSRDGSTQVSYSQSVVLYNQFMGGVDKSDQLRHYYPVCSYVWCKECGKPLCVMVRDPPEEEPSCFEQYHTECLWTQLLQQTIIILVTVYYIIFLNAYTNRYTPLETLDSLPAGTPKRILMRKVSLSP